MTPPFVATYSPLVRLSVNSGITGIREAAEWIIKAAIEDLTSRPDVVASLKANKDLPGYAAWRQMDIRATPDSPIVFKTYTRWWPEHDCWHIMVEAGAETWFEDNGQ